MRKFHAVGDGTTRRVWYIDRLWELAAELEPETVRLDAFDAFERDAWFGHTHRPTLGAVARHAQRIQQADLRFPIILGEDGRVMDGLHRLARAHAEGHPTIETVRFAEDPPPDLEEPWTQPGPIDVVTAQVEAWNRGDLEGYLEAVHADVLYRHGDLVVRGREALRLHYQGRVSGQLHVEVEEVARREGAAVLALRARLEGRAGWRGHALLTLELLDGRWWVTADATSSC